MTASAGTTATLTYDPLGRLASVAHAGSSTHFLHDGPSIVAEYDGAAAMLRRYVHGAGVDAPVALYEGSATGLANRDYHLPDERGSVVGVVNHDGTMRQVNSYDEYGIPASTNLGRFQYTGQAWLPELGMYYYKARIYSPTLGRFMQTDPIGYGDGMNMYAYVGADPVNFVDPFGLEGYPDEEVFGSRCPTFGTCFYPSELDPGLPEIGFVDEEGGTGGETVVTVTAKPLPKKENDYCAGYQTLRIAINVLGTAGDGAGALEDVLSRAKMSNLPQARGFMIGLKFIEGFGLGGSVAISYWLGHRYGDWNTFYEELGGALAGGLFAGAYKRIGRILEPGRDYDLIADIIANVVPVGVDLKSSGRCAR